MELQASPAQRPRADWRATVRAQRTEIEGLLDDSPSLRRDVAGLLAWTIPRARRQVAGSLADHNESPVVALDQLGYTEGQVLGDWFPDPPGPEKP